MTNGMMDEETRQWAMYLHLSLLAGYVIPLAGFVAPVLIWQLKKTDLPAIDDHGKVVINWLISGLIYATICLILFVVFIGIPLMVILGLMAVAFPIIGGIKASNGELWKYPFSIPFLK